MVQLVFYADMGRKCAQVFSFIVSYYFIGVRNRNLPHFFFLICFIGAAAIIA